MSGEIGTNLRLYQINDSRADADKFRELDFAQLYLLAATGRAQAFRVESVPWTETITVELKPLPSYRNASGTAFAIVPGSLQRAAHSPPAQD
ncbi:hypothetical protein [Dongia sp.]|uniref:hypothetical protein n=1 Tax=Dongia sp. TaxID=1977262 RepID=UPI0035B43C06